ncbi:MAG TPA: HlyD family efflux transporter periplasmic adaptor subunit [Phycisphaerae bacterium]|jgi:multidrug resistance efflux pump
MRKVLVIAALAVAAVAVLVWSRRRTEPFYVSGFIEADQIRVGSRVGGRVRDVQAIEGQRVAKGDVLLTLEPFDLNERLAQAQATLAARQAELDRMQAGLRPEEIEQARARRDEAKAVLDKLVAGPRPLEIQMLQHRLELAEADLLKAEHEYARVSGLREQGQAAQVETDEATRALSAARARAAGARDELDLAKEGTRAEEIAQARAKLAEAEQALALAEKGNRQEDIDAAKANVEAGRAAVAMIQQQIEELTLRAPLDSVIEAVDLQPGDMVSPNAPVISLLISESLYVRAYMPEARLNVKNGDKMWIRVNAFPNRRFAGHITFVAHEAEFTPSNVQTAEKRAELVFRIKVKIDEGLDLLRAGMSADIFPEPP